MAQVNVTPQVETTAPVAVTMARADAVKVSVELEGMKQVAHGANRVYAEAFVAWSVEVAPSVKWFEMTFDDLRKASKDLFGEAKAFRSEYVTTNISKVWSDVKTYAKEYVKKTPNLCEIYYGVPEIIEETIDDGDEDGGEGKGNPERTAEEVIRSAKKSGGVWLYRNLVKRDSLKPDENAFLVALRAALVGYGISTTELDK